MDYVVKLKSIRKSVFEKIKEKVIEVSKEEEELTRDIDKVFDKLIYELKSGNCKTNNEELKK